MRHLLCKRTKRGSQSAIYSPFIFVCVRYLAQQLKINRKHATIKQWLRTKLPQYPRVLRQRYIHHLSLYTRVLMTKQTPQSTFLQRYIHRLFPIIFVCKTVPGIANTPVYFNVHFSRCKISVIQREEQSITKKFLGTRYHPISRRNKFHTPMKLMPSDSESRGGSFQMIYLFSPQQVKFLINIAGSHLREILRNNIYLIFNKSK